MPQEALDRPESVERLLSNIAEKAWLMYENRYALCLPGHTFTQDAIQEFMRGLTEKAMYNPAFVIDYLPGEPFSLCKWWSMSEAARRKFIRVSVTRSGIDLWRVDDLKDCVRIRPLVQSKPLDNDDGPKLSDENDEVMVVEAAIVNAGSSNVTKLLGKSPFEPPDRESESGVLDEAPTIARDTDKPKRQTLPARRYKIAPSGDVSDSDSESQRDALINQTEARRQLQRFLPIHTQLMQSDDPLERAWAESKLPLVDAIRDVLIRPVNPLLRIKPQVKLTLFDGRQARSETERQVAEELNLPKTTVNRAFRKIEDRVKVQLERGQTEMKAAA